MIRFFDSLFGRSVGAESVVQPLIRLQPPGDAGRNNYALRSRRPGLPEETAECEVQQIANDPSQMPDSDGMPLASRQRAIYRRHYPYRFEAAPALSSQPQDMRTVALDIDASASSHGGGDTVRSTAMLLSYPDRAEGAHSEKGGDGLKRFPHFARK